MKVRTGFVSNSSSSSFCIIGTDNEDLIKSLALAVGLEKDEEGYYPLCFGGDTIEILTFIGSYHDIRYVGMDAEPLLKTMTIPEAKEHVAKLITEKYGIKVTPGNLRLEYGVSSSD